MNKTAAALALTLASLLAHAADEPTSAKLALAQFHDALTKGDRDRALSLLATDVVIYEGGHVERSRDEYARHHLDADMQFAKTATTKTLRETERTGADQTVIWRETDTAGTAGGKPVRLLGAETAVLEKRDAAWRIIHLHWSSRKPASH